MISNHLKNREHKLNKRESFKNKGKQETVVEEDPKLVELRKKQVTVIGIILFSWSANPLKFLNTIQINSNSTFKM